MKQKSVEEKSVIRSKDTKERWTLSAFCGFTPKRGKRCGRFTYDTIHPGDVVPEKVYCVHHRKKGDK